MQSLKQTNKPGFYGTRFLGNRVLFFIFILGAALFYFETVHAGLASYVTSLLVGDRADAKTSSRSSAGNSQTMNLLAAAANSDPNPNKPIQVIPVHGGETLVPDLAAENIETAEYSTQISTYIVRDGDTVSGVAKMFNVSVNTVIWANNLTTKSVLQPGQNLVILPVTGVAHTVEKNESISSIAKKYNADVADIYSFNDIAPSSVISVGQKIIVPNAELAPKTAVGQKSKAPYEPAANDAASLPLYSGYYSCPVPDSRMSQGLHGRNGVDLAAPKGAIIYASAPGTVIVHKSNGAWNGGYGNFIVISHGNGTQTLYSHMTNATVSLGQKVSSGQKIGYVGSTGLSTGPHLHFEIRGAKNPFIKSGCN